MHVKILSWNLWWSNNIAKAIDFLKTSHADIIGLQEVVQDVGGENNTAKAVAGTLGYSYTYATASQRQREGRTFEWGNAILSRYKIIGNKTHILSERDRRIALQADIGVNNITLSVFNTHLIHTHLQSSPIQREQTSTLVTILPHEKTLLIGDFNATPESNLIKKVRQKLKQTDSRLTPTWSMYKEGCRICKPDGVRYKLDYIFASNDIRVSSSKVEESNASDHLPISVIVEV